MTIDKLRCGFISIENNQPLRCEHNSVKYKVSSPYLTKLSNRFLKIYDAQFPDGDYTNKVLSTEGKFEPSQEGGSGMIPYTYVIYTHSEEEASIILGMLNKFFPKHTNLHKVFEV
jgi:hypothetical protein